MVRRAMIGLAAMLAWGCARQPPGPPKRVAQRGNPISAAERASRRARLTAAAPRFDTILDEVLSENPIPSMTAGLLSDGELVWWRGRGPRQLDRPEMADAHTVYRIGSVTKPITAMAILRLRDEGLIELDAPASRYMPELGAVVLPTQDSPPITVRHLLTHTSGLPRLGGFDYATRGRPPVTEQEVVARLEGQPLSHAPGTHHAYSNWGYALLGILVGRVSRLSFRQYATRHLLSPMGLNSFYWDARHVPHDLLAVPYRYEKRGQQWIPHHHWPMGAAEGMGGLYTSLYDLARFTGYQMTAWPPGARADAPPLSNATLRESHMMFGHMAKSKGTGAGWGVGQLSGLGHVVFHSGATDGYAAAVLFLPRHRLGAVVLANSGKANKPIDGLARRLVVEAARQLGAARASSRAKKKMPKLRFPRPGARP